MNARAKIKEIPLVSSVEKIPLVSSVEKDTCAKK
jgi:hypothetical protein